MKNPVPNLERAGNAFPAPARACDHAGRMGLEAAGGVSLMRERGRCLKGRGSDVGCLPVSFPAKGKWVCVAGVFGNGDVLAVGQGFGPTSRWRLIVNHTCPRLIAGPITKPSGTEAMHQRARAASIGQAADWVGAASSASISASLPSARSYFASVMVLPFSSALKIAPPPKAFSPMVEGESPRRSAMALIRAMSF